MTCIIYGCVNCHIDDEGNALTFAVPKGAENQDGFKKIHCPLCGCHETVTPIGEAELDLEVVRGLNSINTNRDMYDQCEMPCKCKTCGNDHHGVCGMDGTGCKTVRKDERCPREICANWVPRSTTIADKIRELREAFREEYGLDICIAIYAHDHHNPEIDRRKAETIGQQIADVFTKKAEVRHTAEDGRHWLKIDPPWEEHTNITLFYKEEPNEQSD